MAAQRLCAFSGCRNAGRARGYCGTHYARLKRQGAFLHSAAEPQALCAAAGCDGAAFTRGYCSKHYQRWRNNGDPLTVRRGGNKKGCSLPDRVRLDMGAVAWMYEIERLPAASIAQKFRCSKPTILRRLRAAGIKIRHHNDTKRGAPSPRRQKINVVRAAKLYAAKNASITSVAQTLGVCSGALRRAFEDKGVRIKTLSQVIDGSRNGDSNPNWNPTLTDREREIRRPSSKHATWRDAVYARDGFACQSCGDDRGGNLNAHHLSSYHADKEKRWEVSNGITLCDPCHRSFHKSFGYKNNTEAQFQEFLAERQAAAA